MSNKKFAERLNKALDDIGVPQKSDERVDVFSKLLKIPRFKADSLLNGTMLPDEPLLVLLTNELEITQAWLLGRES